MRGFARTTSSPACTSSYDRNRAWPTSCCRPCSSSTTTLPGRRTSSSVPSCRGAWRVRNHELVCALARVGATHRGFDMSPRASTDPTASGYRTRRAEARWFDVQPDFRTAHSSTASDTRTTAGFRAGLGRGPSRRRSTPTCSRHCPLPTLGGDRGSRRRPPFRLATSPPAISHRVSTRPHAANAGPYCRYMRDAAPRHR